MSILDLPDEILLCILNKLNNINVLYSLVDVNGRFDRLALDSIYIRDLDFTANDKSQKFHQFLDRLCTSILPRIHHQINKLTLGQLSIERLLHIVDYPQLYSLSLVFCQPKIILNFNRYEPNLFALILSFAKCLTDFTLVQCLRDASTNSLFTLFSTNCVSSTLAKLKIDVNTFNDCLYILDGRFDWFIDINY
ncbi:unnamed protein product [Rotaria magnacalcarata]|uniref:F-box domain-containing protein n=1 Tax=Rotaria magnacalcarata TaxID=392030 RepID=A0A819BZC5_9BILA|nr:unnamed protein product [Rotaria magnacalcarata]CAF4313492.1 unnamed protein product [Rotaria magnacalcarata]CAF4536962.1 unnamed protein product [Rotaria magnacalcarata]